LPVCVSITNLRYMARLKMAAIKYKTVVCKNYLKSHIFSGDKIIFFLNGFMTNNKVLNFI